MAVLEVVTCKSVACSVLFMIISEQGTAQEKIRKKQCSVQFDSYIYCSCFKGCRLFLTHFLYRYKDLYVK
jgi:hypothetical protein